MKPEAKLWQKIRGPMKSRGHVDRIESNATSLGRPDVDWFVDGYPWPIELKVAKGGKITVRPSQKMWHRNRDRAGGISWFLVEIPGGKADSTYLLVLGCAGAGLPPDIEDWIVNCAGLWYGDINWDDLTFILRAHEPS